MIRTILVDDEAPALLKLKNLLLPYAEYTLCGEYTDANEALADLDRTRPQVAFLDVAMPSMNGMDLALAIQQRMGSLVQIVFVSAYDEYALTAFEVHATDYLLKPVTRARFKQTIERLNAFLAMQSASMAVVPHVPEQNAS
jgi:two-component SAPR family response regulator